MNNSLGDLACAQLTASHDQAELVATETRDDVRATAAKQRCDLNQDAVTRFVAKGVIDRLEAIQIYKHDCHHGSIALGVCQP